MLKAALAFVAFTGLAAGQSSQWTQLPAPASPHTTSGAAIAYDHLRDRALVFGGQSSGLPRAWLTAFDGSNWTSAAAGGPAARTGHKLVFDERRGQTLLFAGGVIGQTFDDTWLWDGASWTQASPPQSPPRAYGGFSLTYDEARELVVFYDGTSLYEWDGSNWQLRTPAISPPLRSHHAAAYDSRRNRLVIAGGISGFTTLTDVWEWDGINWQQVATTAPALRSPQMVFDRERGLFVVVSAMHCYEFDGSAWSPAPAPPPGDGLMLTYDRQRGRVLCVFGWTGQSSVPSGSTWMYDISDLAVAQPFGIGCGSPALIAREDPQSRPLLGSTLAVDIENAPTGVAYMCFGLSGDQVLNLSLPRRMDVWGLPGCWLLQSDEEIFWPCATTGATTARFSIALPSSPNFLGFPFFLQPWAPAPGLNPANAAIGNGIAVTIGAR